MSKQVMLSDKTIFILLLVALLLSISSIGYLAWTDSQVARPAVKSPQQRRQDTFEEVAAEELVLEEEPEVITETVYPVEQVEPPVEAEAEVPEKGYSHSIAIACESGDYEGFMNAYRVLSHEKSEALPKFLTGCLLKIIFVPKPKFVSKWQVYLKLVKQVIELPEFEDEAKYHTLEDQDGLEMSPLIQAIILDHRKILDVFVVAGEKFDLTMCFHHSIPEENFLEYLRRPQLDRYYRDYNLFTKATAIRNLFAIFDYFPDLIIYSDKRCPADAYDVLGIPQDLHNEIHALKEGKLTWEIFSAMKHPQNLVFRAIRFGYEEQANLIGQFAKRYDLEKRQGAGPLTYHFLGVAGSSIARSYRCLEPWREIQQDTAWAFLTGYVPELASQPVKTIFRLLDKVKLDVRFKEEYQSLAYIRLLIEKKRKQGATLNSRGQSK